jgi:hypothetical protein
LLAEACAADVDPNAYSQGIDSSEDGPDTVLAGLEFERLQDNFSLSKSAPQDHDDIFKEVRVASELSPVASAYSFAYVSCCPNAYCFVL